MTRMTTCRSVLAVALAMFLSVCVASCAGTKRGGPAFYAGEAAAKVPASESSFRSRLLIARASMEVSVESVPEAVEKATEIVKESGGYVRESTTGKDSAARLKLRVPAERLTEVLDRLAQLGEEKNRHVSSEDVTEQVIDLEAEVTNKRALRDRLRVLLDRAKDVKDVLAVEEELTRVQTDIDRLEGRLKQMREDIALSAVDLKLSPKPASKKRRILGPLGYMYVGTKWFITKLFVIRPGEP